MSRNKRLCYEGNAHNQSINRDELIGFTLTGDTLNGILMNVVALVTGTHVANPTRIWWRDWNRSSWNWRGNRTSSLLATRPSYAAFWPIFSTKLQVCISPSSFFHIQSANRVDLVIDNSSGRLISSIKSIKTVWFLLTLSFIHPYFINWLFSWLVNHFKWIGFWVQLQVYISPLYLIKRTRRIKSIPSVNYSFNWRMAEWNCRFIRTCSFSLAYSTRLIDWLFIWWANLAVRLTHFWVKLQVHIASFNRWLIIHLIG